MRRPSYYIGRPVESLQTMLRVIAAGDSEIPGPIPDGIYGAETMRAVTAMQRKASLPPTGVTDLCTWNAVRDAYYAAQIETAPAAPLQIALSPRQTIGEGSDNLHVLLIQAMLHTVAGAYASMPDCTLSGVCDEKTVCAVRALQKCCGMEQTGCIDKALWRQLVGLYAQVAGTGDLPCESGASRPKAIETGPGCAPHGEAALYEE